MGATLLPLKDIHRGSVGGEGRSVVLNSQGVDPFYMHLRSQEAAKTITKYPSNSDP